MKKIYILAIALMCGVILTACSGSNSGSNAGNSATISDRVASVYRVGTYAYKSPIPSYNYTSSETNDTFSLRQSGDNLAMTINGVEYIFTPDVNSFNNTIEWINSNNVTLAIENLLTDTYDIRQVIGGTHERIKGTYIYYNINKFDYAVGEDIPTTPFDSREGYTTVGVQTPASDVALQTAFASYTGTLDFPVNKEIRRPETPLARIFLFGDLTMHVNFDANTISGTARVSRRVDNSGSFYAGMVIFNQAPIVGNGFAGTFNLEADVRRAMDIIDNPTGNYAGNFFGENAEDLAGVMRLNGTTLENGAAFGHGGFRADRQVFNN